MISRFVGWVARWSLEHPAVILLLVGVVTIASLAVLPNAVIASSVRTLFFGDDHPEFAEYEELTRRFASDEVHLFGIESGDPFSPESLKQLRRFHQAVEPLPEVAKVHSILNLERVELVGDTVRVRRYADEALADPTRAGPILESLRGDPIAGSFFVARRANHHLVMVELTFDPHRKAEAGPKALDQFLEAFEAAGIEASSIHRAGLAPTIAEIMHQTEVNILVLFPIVCVFLLVSVFLMFGRPWPVFVTTISALLAVIWTMASHVARDPEVSIMLSILPALVMIISFSDVVHLCSAYLLNIEAGMKKREAVETATIEVGAACFLTSFTTAVGFIALTFVPAPAFRTLGVAAATGVIAAYGGAITLVPVILNALPEPKPWHEGTVGWIQRRLDAYLSWTAELTTTRPWPIFIGFMVFFAVCLWGSLQVEVETKFTGRLDEGNVIRQDELFMEEHFIRPWVVDLYVTAPDGLLTAEAFNALYSLEEEIERREGVDKVTSFGDLMKATWRTLVPDPDAQFVPLQGDAIAQLMVLLEMQGQEGLAPFIDFGRKTAHLTIYVDEEGIVSQHQARVEITELAKERLEPLGLTVVGTGIGPLLGAWVDNIIEGQRRGLLFSFLVIMLILVLGFRSVRAGVLAMIPNVLPLLALGAYCGLVWETTDSDTLIIAMIAIGIGVDDTIHFIARLQLERRRTEDITEAVRQTFRFSGRGIFITTFIFVVGFLPMMGSDYFSLYLMGTLLPMCFVVALLADLYMVPAMARLKII